MDLSDEFVMDLLACSFLQGDWIVSCRVDLWWIVDMFPMEKGLCCSSVCGYSVERCDAVL